MRPQNAVFYMKIILHSRLFERSVIQLAIEYLTLSGGHIWKKLKFGLQKNCPLRQ